MMDGSILLISDIHADLQALDEIVEMAYSDAFSKRYGPLKKIINLGDVIERGHHPHEVVERLKGLKNVESILGNHDEAFLFFRAICMPDPESVKAHKAYRSTGKYRGFFEGMHKNYIDSSSLLYAAHGGPIDQFSLITDEMDIETGWLFSQTWQRISEMGTRYLDPSGYHYLPEDAFEEVKVEFKRNGFIILCGHEHEEAAYRQQGDTVDNMLAKLEEHMIDLNGRQVTEKRLDIEGNSNYLVRVGIAGPEGYLSRSARDRSYFGVLQEKAGRRTLYLLNFDRQHRDHR
jgi:predicted phosphodiesterase